jgi:putative ABC transport system permease protein
MSNKPPDLFTPPHWPNKLLEWLCPDHLLEEVQGDLQERYNLRVQKLGVKKARQQYLKEVLSYVRHAIFSTKRTHLTFSPFMFNNYLKVALRNLLRHKTFSFINIFGLAVAMSVCMLIMLMLADQKSYDQFHANKDKIYRILSIPKNARQPYATTPFPLAATLKADYPVVEEATHLLAGVGGDALYDQKIVEMRGFFTDPSFFKIFSYELVHGDKTTALASPNTMVISGKIAKQLFPHENPVGKLIEFSDRGLHYLHSGQDSPPVSWGTFTVTGVMAESDKSHLKFDVLVSASSLPALYQAQKISNLTDNWTDHHQTWTYVLISPTKTSNDLYAALQGLVSQKYAGLKDFTGFELSGQKLAEINTNLLSNELTYRLPAFVYYFLSVLAAVIMVSACLNYTNLSIARALTRAKEIGVRKVTGAKRKNLVFQFLGESALTAFLSLGMAILLLIAIKHAFKGLWINQFLNFELQASLPVYLIFAGFALFIGILAGIFPALHLSSFQPVHVLKNLDAMRPGKLGVRKVLSITQLVVSLFFITSSILVYKQFKHFLEFDYNFASKNIINIELQGNEYQKVATRFASLPDVSAISACDIIPALSRSSSISLKKPGSEAELACGFLQVDENFAVNLQLKLLAGRDLPAKGEATDKFIIINETTVKELGYSTPSDAIGQTVEASAGKEALQIIGVVEDFRFRLLLNQDKIGPLVLKNEPGSFKYANVRLTSTDTKTTIAHLESAWKTIDPVHPFKYDFFEDQLATTHQGILDVVSVIGFIAFLAVTIACLGMLGMATYTAERKVKEIGIRKVLGAENRNIAWWLSKGFISMLAISILIGAPLSYMVNNLWLQNFPNRVEFGPDILFLGSAILLVLGILTIGSQTIRASLQNPVKSLRKD